MKLKIEIDGTGDKQTEFMMMTYDAYVAALQKMIEKQIDPYNFLKPNK